LFFCGHYFRFFLVAGEKLRPDTNEFAAVWVTISTIKMNEGKGLPEEPFSIYRMTIEINSGITYLIVVNSFGEFISNIRFEAGTFHDFNQINKEIPNPKI